MSSISFRLPQALPWLPRERSSSIYTDITYGRIRAKKVPRAGTCGPRHIIALTNTKFAASVPQNVHWDATTLP